MTPVVKNPPANVEDIKDTGPIPGLGRSLEEDMTTHSSFLSGESQEQRSLVGYNP